MEPANAPLFKPLKDGMLHNSILEIRTNDRVFVRPQMEYKPRSETISMVNVCSKIWLVRMKPKDEISVTFLGRKSGSGVQDGVIEVTIRKVYLATFD